MGRELQEGKEAIEGDIQLQRNDSQEICQNEEVKKEKPGRRQKESAPRITDIDLIKITIRHFFGERFNLWIDAIGDPRAKEQCVYSLRHLFWLGLLMFILRLQSRRQLATERETTCFLQNILELSGTTEETIAHPDTLNYAMERIVPQEIEELKIKMIKQLISDRRLDQFRFFGEFRIAIDGTGLFAFREKHCEHCLVTEHSNGKTTWSHKMLEAKLVSENGFALSICSEPIENQNGIYDKQDCELKAFYRLAKRIKAFFPRTPLCLLLDALYACKEVFGICKTNNWSFIIAFKEGSIPNLYSEAMRRKNLKTSITIHSNDMTQKLSWVNKLGYEGFSLHALFCEETDGKEKAQWSWLTDRNPNPDNVYELANKGGRQRWKIENQGFNEQKRHGFELEHLYGYDSNAWKNYYQLIQIAHIITQLIVYGDLCQKLQTLSSGHKHTLSLPFLKYYQSIRNFARRLAESFRNFRFSECSKKDSIQIRFSSA